MKYVIESAGAEETLALGKRLGSKAFAGMLICLNGDLGTGKTVFTKGFALGLGITEPVCSPTFTVLGVYDEGRIPLYHFDVYRIDDPMEMEEIGYREYFYGEGVSIIEWSELISELIPGDAVHILIEKDVSKGFDYRRITIEGENIEYIGD